ncbi:MAG: hypothetical protein HY961_08885 [Ignavibacteriae bacterium]|nr:hypothetical protein [Ignavibacteriota bacterium]
MKTRLWLMMGATVLIVQLATIGQEKDEKVSFKASVFPIIKARCLPCHSEDNFNPSELSMDSYDQIAKGGKNGVPFKPGNSKESLMIQKLSEDPPFGDRMPLNSKKKIREGKAVWLNAEQIKTIATWIDQGAKNN